jgi:hypothetical protein
VQNVEFGSEAARQLAPIPQRRFRCGPKISGNEKTCDGNHARRESKYPAGPDDAGILSKDARVARPARGREREIVGTREEFFTPATWGTSIARAAARVRSSMTVARLSA